MNNPLITGKEVLDRLYSHLRDEVKFSQTTLLKHKRNWDSVCSFAQEQGLSLDFSDIDNLQRFAYRMAFDGKELIERNHSIPYSFQLIQEYIKYGEIFSTNPNTHLTGPMSDERIRYLSIKKSEHLRASSYRAYEIHLSRFLSFLQEQGVKSVSEISTSTVRMYIMELKPECKSSGILVRWTAIF